jgi:hypothetical protein
VDESNWPRRDLPGAEVGQLDVVKVGTLPSRRNTNCETEAQGQRSLKTVLVKEQLTLNNVQYTYTLNRRDMVFVAVVDVDTHNP